MKKSELIKPNIEHIQFFSSESYLSK